MTWTTDDDIATSILAETLGGAKSRRHGLTPALEQEIVIEELLRQGAADRSLDAMRRGGARDAGFRNIGQLEWLADHVLGNEQKTVMGMRAGDFVPGVQQRLAARDLAELNQVDTSNLGLGDRAMVTGAKGLAGIGLLPALGGITGPARRAITDRVRGTVGDMLARQAEAGARKPIRDMSLDELEAYGRQHGVDLSLTEPRAVVDPGTGREWMIPGGLESPLTIPDEMWLKSRAYNPTEMSPEFQTRLQKRLLEATTPYPEDLGNPVTMFNRIMFGMESPNTPLLTNQFMTTRMRAQSADDIRSLGDMIPWEPGDATVPKEVRAAYDKEIARAFGIQAADQGGTGMRSSVDLTNIAEFAKLYSRHPEFFQKRPGEEWSQFAERLINVQRGLSPKTASFGAVWQEPGLADISAMDRHMARNFRPVLLNDPELGPQIREQRVRLWNDQLAERPGIEAEAAKLFEEKAGWSPRTQKTIAKIEGELEDYRGRLEAAKAAKKKTAAIEKSIASREAKLEEAKGRLTLVDQADKDAMDKIKKRLDKLPPPGSAPVRTYDEILTQGRGADNWDADQIITDSTKHQTKIYRPAAEKGGINPEIPEHLRDLPVEPEQALFFGDIYRRMLAHNEELAKKQGLNTFGEQWRIWDRIREQVEPHEAMHRDLYKLPKMPLDELNQAFQHQKRSGFHTSGRKSTGERHVSPFDWQKGLYWGLGGASMIPLLQAIQGYGLEPDA